MQHSSKYVLTLLVVFALAVGGTLYAQTTKGTIAGVVTDAQGLVVPGVSVTASAADGGNVRSTTTGSNGEYRIEALSLGKYVVRVVAKGFAETIVRDVVVNASQITATNIELKVAAASETVTVEAGAETIQTESGACQNDSASGCQRVFVHQAEPVPTGGQPSGCDHGGLPGRYDQRPVVLSKRATTSRQ
ncbi:MAG TPA: carboxypeptidase-like regulatory domain-containing protein [Terriglobales bacterium]|nr:carboxypeptidase-like regulatory domain-containing protein [Terriglobales bacterium]